DREKALGGILPQCIHNGFGLHIFGEELTGPEYAARYIDRAVSCGVSFLMNTMVLHISHDKNITAVGRDTGMMTIRANAVVLAMGCRERSAGALMIPGTRPSGVLTAGTAQRFVNIDGYMPGKEVVILGSGDIGLIMARRMTLEGAKVKMVLELMPYSGGLKRNIVQCLDDFGIPLRLSHTVTRIHGKKRLEGVTTAAVDKDGVPIRESEEYVACDTLLLSVGLIPENELSREIGVAVDPATGGPVVDSGMQTSVPGVFACGNVVQVHDLADFVSQEAKRAGKAAAAYHENGDALLFRTIASEGVRYVVPQRVKNDGEDKALFFRTADVYKNCRTVAVCGGRVIARKKRMIATPGEMETLTVKAADITGDITVSVEEDA
ncbi:MAG: FAD-dependent oxidoreductase, partial [Eubacteriales bacterium]|nr:FAD-dependent oxidoreductase [Eubacteriales bacterium]